MFMMLSCRVCAHLLAYGLLARSRADECESAEPPPSTQLLQRDLALIGARGGAAPRRAVAPRRAEANIKLVQRPDWAPLYWMHVPKCGSSFGNSFFHVPGACQNVTEDFAWYGVWFDFDGMDALQCDSDVLTLDGFGSHMSVNPRWDMLEGHLATMLRQPAQRVISAWNYAIQLYGPNNFRGKTVLEFAKLNQGLLTKMLTDDGEIIWGNEGHAVTEMDATIAAVRIRDGFVFVGMLEEWDLSICLFNVMFNSDCLELQFATTNSGSGGDHIPIVNATGLYDESVLAGFRDEYDAIPYHAGQMHFAQKLRQYGVSDESCSGCYAQARRTSR